MGKGADETATRSRQCEFVRSFVCFEWNKYDGEDSETDRRGCWPVRLGRRRDTDWRDWRHRSGKGAGGVVVRLAGQPHSATPATAAGFLSVALGDSGDESENSVTQNEQEEKRRAPRKMTRAKKYGTGETHGTVDGRTRACAQCLRCQGVAFRRSIRRASRGGLANFFAATRDVTKTHEEKCLNVDSPS